MVQRYSSHRSVQMVLRYTHPSDGHIDEALDGIGTAVPEGNVLNLGAARTAEKP